MVLPHSGQSPLAWSSNNFIYLASLLTGMKRCTSFFLIFGLLLVFAAVPIAAKPNMMYEGDKIVLNDTLGPVFLELIRVSDLAHAALFRLNNETGKSLMQNQEYRFKNGYTLHVSKVLTDEATEGRDLVEFYIYRSSRFPDTGLISQYPEEPASSTDTSSNYMIVRDNRMQLAEASSTGKGVPTIEGDVPIRDDSIYESMDQRRETYDAFSKERAKQSLLGNRFVETYKVPDYNKSSEVVEEEIVPPQETIPAVEEKAAAEEEAVQQEPEIKVQAKTEEKRSLFGKMADWFKNLF